MEEIEPWYYSLKILAYANILANLHVIHEHCTNFIHMGSTPCHTLGWTLNVNFIIFVSNNVYMGALCEEPLFPLIVTFFYNMHIFESLKFDYYYCFASDFNIYIYKLLVLIFKIVKAMKMHLNDKIMW